MHSLFNGVFDNSGAVGLEKFIICIIISLIIGGILSYAYAYKSKYTQSFILTLAILPTIVCVVIMMVNGNVGAGVAVAGAFSLVRFRSAPGSAREICAIFAAMASGIVTGMGYLAYGVLFALIISLVMYLYTVMNFGGKMGKDYEKNLTVTIPENLDYSGIFDDLFEEYTYKNQLCSVKTTNMGSMYKLNYLINLKDQTKEKEFLDKIRCRNGNLEIVLGRKERSLEEL